MDDEIELVLRRADALCDLNRPAAALALLASVPAQGAPDHRVWLTRARALYDDGRHAAALDAAGRAIALAPDDPNGHLILSRAQKATGSPYEAVASAVTACRLAPHAASCHRQLASALLGVDPKSTPIPGGRRALDEASAAATRAVELAPDEPTGLLLLAAVRDGQGDYARRDQAAARALELAPDSDVVHNDVARLYHGHAGYARAAAGFVNAARLRPDGVAVGNLALTVRQALDRPILTTVAKLAQPVWVLLIISGHLGDRQTVLLVWALLLATLALVPWWQIGAFFRGLPPDKRRPVVRAIRRDRPLATRFVLLALSAVLLPAAAVPSPATPGLLACGVGCYLGALAAIYWSLRHGQATIRLRYRLRFSRRRRSG